MAKGNIRIGISTDDVDRMADELEEDIVESLEDSAKEIRKEGREAARDHIRRHDKLWTRELLNSWVPYQTKSAGGSAGVILMGFQNYADHAAAIDQGAVYTNKKPPVDALMPYVIENYPASPAMSHRDWAFWLQDVIFQNGIEGIFYTEYAQEEMEAKANKIIKRNARKDL